ncbi:TraV family lipoprotein [Novosphingobium subterraneum]|uniref:Conjugal transfer pilus assembly protein TraV n=2 Tax=Novosphingobium subterraneum TaxID=48936 RepID=A0A0B8ZGR2_9SPHN|nr:conjugal transfer pilus assembly protein TraV [Novosphingobium subterraneum]
MSLQLHMLCVFQSIPSARSVMVLLSSAALSSCGVLLGDNVKGNFICSAPGGTCAPSTLIDDQALALIEGARPEVSGSQQPIGFSQAKARAETFRSVSRSSQGGQFKSPARVRDNLLHRETRTLRLVFPAYVDDAGNLHEARVVHTVVDRGGWIELTDGSLAPLAGTYPSQDEDLPATPAPDPPETSISDQSLSAPALDKIEGPVSPGGAPPTSPLTIDAIRAQVAERLATTRKPPTTVQPQADGPRAGASTPSEKGRPPESSATISARPGMPLAANPPASFSTPEVD